MDFSGELENARVQILKRMRSVFPVFTGMLLSRTHQIKIEGLKT